MATSILSLSPSSKNAWRPTVFNNFWFAHVLRATGSCTFSTSEARSCQKQSVFHIRLANVLRATPACTFATCEGEVPKVVRDCKFLILVTWKNALWKACIYSTSQPLKRVRDCLFLTLFTLEMCFALQRRALFQRLNFQKCSAPKVFLTCWLPNALRATAACTFFDISASKSGPSIRSFWHFDFNMCSTSHLHSIFDLSSPHLPL